MIAVHDVFICKPGNASKLAKLFKEWADFMPTKSTQIMTDMSGQFHRVIVAATFESLAAYEEEMKNMGQSPEEQDNDGKVQGHERDVCFGKPRDLPRRSGEAGKPFVQPQKCRSFGRVIAEIVTPFVGDT